MTSLIDLRAMMTESMYWELNQLVCDTRDGDGPTVELVKVSKEGYLHNGEYVGTLAKGERMHRVDTMHCSRLVRSRCTATQLRKAFGR